MIKIEELKDVNQVKFEQHVPILMQKAMAETLVNMLVKEDANGFKHYNSIDVDVAIDVAYVSLFTDIELTEDDYVNYDMLVELGIIAEIEYQRAFNNFENMVYSYIEDVMRENAIEYTMSKTSSGVIDAVDKLVDRLGAMIDKGDPNTIAKYLSKGIEAIAVKLPDMTKLAEKAMKTKRG